MPMPINLLTNLLRKLGCGLLLLLLAPASVDAADTIITPYIGYRGGGDVEDVFTGSTVDVEESDSQGLILGWEMEGGEFEIVYARQSSELEAGSNVSPSVLVDVEITQLLASGKSIFDPQLGTYFAFMVGFSHFDFDGTGFDSDTRIALGLGSGIDYRLSDNVGLRAGLRGVFTFVDTSDGAFCTSSTSCPIVASDNTLEQWELFTGLSFRF